MEKLPSPPRFIKGKLVMLSRKVTISGSLPYFKQSLVSNIKSTPNFFGTLFAGRLKRGEPILLVEDPVIVSRKEIKTTIADQLGNHKDGIFWKIVFLLDEHIYEMFLTNRQFNHELVKSVERRMTKDYSNAVHKTAY